MSQSFAAALTALTLALSLPAWAGGAYPAKTPEQSAQLQSEQKRLPAAKEDTSTAGQQAGATSDASATTEKTTESGQTSKGQGDQAQAKKHPPTAVMDKATSPEKSTSETGAPPKHPPATVMDRATPEQKSPGSAEAPK